MDATEQVSWGGVIVSAEPDDSGVGIREQAENRLRGNSYLALHDLGCTVADGVLVVRGRVPSYFLKQVVSAAVADIEGVDRIVNQVEVVRPGPARAGHSSGLRDTEEA
jgi:hypothetical protein